MSSGSSVQPLEIKTNDVLSARPLSGDTMVVPLVGGELVRNMIHADATISGRVPLHTLTPNLFGKNNQ